MIRFRNIFHRKKFREKCAASRSARVRVRVHDAMDEPHKRARIGGAPIDALPGEILALIFAWLTCENMDVAAMAVPYVCRRWRHVAATAHYWTSAFRRWLRWTPPPQQQQQHDQPNHLRLLCACLHLARGIPAFPRDDVLHRALFDRAPCTALTPVVSTSWGSVLGFLVSTVARRAGSRARVLVPEWWTRGAWHQIREGLEILPPALVCCCFPDIRFINGSHIEVASVAVLSQRDDAPVPARALDFDVIYQPKLELALPFACTMKQNPVASSMIVCFSTGAGYSMGAADLEAEASRYDDDDWHTFRHEVDGLRSVLAPLTWGHAEHSARFPTPPFDRSFVVNRGV